MGRANTGWHAGLLGAVLVATCLSPGCGRSGPPSGIKPAATAEEALRGFLKGVKDLDERAALACCKATAEEGEAICALAEFGRSATTFHALFVAAYGQDAWEQFNDPNYNPGEANANVMLLDGSLDDLMARADLKVRTPTVATFVMPNESRQSRIVKTDAGWLVEVGTLLPPQMEPAKFASLMRAMRDHLHEYRKAVGKPGITADDIDVELGRAIVETLAGAKMSGPHRFEIDKL